MTSTLARIGGGLCVIAGLTLSAIPANATTDTVRGESTSSAAVTQTSGSANRSKTASATTLTVFGRGTLFNQQAGKLDTSLPVPTLACPNWAEYQIQIIAEPVTTVGNCKKGVVTKYGKVGATKLALTNVKSIKVQNGIATLIYNPGTAGIQPVYNTGERASNTHTHELLVQTWNNTRVSSAWVQLPAKGTLVQRTAINAKVGTAAGGWRYLQLGKK